MDILTCAVPYCTRGRERKDWCKTHYEQQRCGNPFKPIRKHEYHKPGEQCPVCGRTAVTSHACKTHYQILLKYKISVDDLLRFLSLPCAICGDTTAPKHIDHDHECCTGPTTCGQCIRGVLCGNCNIGLGMFRNNKNFLRRAADYVSLPRQTSN